jgi:starch-binding outer membrane protein, SusD/RagB family
MKKHTIYILLAGIVTGFAGCKKFLETLPDGRTVVTTPEQIAQLLTTAYPQINYIPFCEAMSDNAEDKGNPTLYADPNTNAVNTQSYKWEVPQFQAFDSPEGYFHACYNAIAAANQALEFTNGPDSASYAPHKGEALLARAYAHFMLVTLFAKTYDPNTAASDPGIPYVTTVEKHAFQNYSRGTVKSVYDNIEADLTRGLPLINEKIYGNAAKFHFTQQAAHAFAARFYLFKRDYNQVIAHSTQVIGGANLANLIRNWNGTSATSNPVGYSASELGYYGLQSQYTKAVENSNILLHEAATVWGGSYAYYRYGYGNNVFNEFNQFGRFMTGGQLSIPYKTYGATPQFYNVPKFYENNGTDVIPLFSMEEVLFNRAESYAMLGNNTAAVKDINTWVSKNVNSYTTANNIATTDAVDYFFPGVSNPDTTAALVNAILRFKQIAYIHEGLRWFDIKRLNIAVQHNYFTGGSDLLAPGDNRRQLQLPQEVQQAGMQLNPR